MVSNFKVTLRRKSYSHFLISIENLFARQKIVGRIFLEGEKHVSHSLEVLGSQTGIPEGLKKKSEISEAKRD